MNNFIKIISITILLSSNIFIDSQESENPPQEPKETHHIISDTLKQTDSVMKHKEKQKAISLNFGFGYGLFTGPMLSVNAIAEITDEFHFSTGADIYILEASGEYSPENPWQFSAVAFYVFRTNTRSQFSLGFGAALNPKLYPLISLRYDYRFKENHSFGAEFKNIFLYGPYVYPFLILSYKLRFKA